MKPSLYRQVMGAEFDKLPSSVQRFHSLAGVHVLSGWVEVDAPASAAAALLARMLGTPRVAHSGPIRFELDAGPLLERWTRHFPRQTMSSRMCLGDSGVIEKLGPARLTFDLVQSADKLAMNLVRMQFLGIPAPPWLRPRVVAEESGSDGRLHFRVQAAVPGLGVVASYRGYLELPAD